MEHGIREEDYGVVARRVRNTYSSFANRYVRLTRDYDRYPGLHDEVAGFVKAARPGRLLDVGCGSGRDGFLAAGSGRFTVFADAAVGILRELGCGGPPVAAVCCDVLALPFSDRVFAATIASGVLLHVPKRNCRSALAELKRVLVTGGMMAISMKQGSGEGWRVAGDVPGERWFAYYDAAEFAGLCENVGLMVLGVEVSGRGSWFTVTARRS